MHCSFRRGFHLLPRQSVYRSEPMRNRMPLTHDPAKIRLVHGGIKETHVFHLHNHQWRLEADLLPEYLEATRSSSGPEQISWDIMCIWSSLIRSHPMGRQNGWNNIAGARKYELWWNRFFADEELRSGTKAVIRRRDGTSFREFALFVHDFANLFDKDGNPLNPPAVPGGHDDPADRRGA